ncbi:hypothetical protein CO172_00400 [Candidatus Uhrbacteria bacterium CG_4_9_14_3_um_filter_36_7]|uniref:OmpA-like domain-containing protein n=1 Tax=Candidatus Uhrbacteria bacterium CG_4_9_14_3_um_filter_36_7 TaxID=1975033 RepID=A0A2M7XIC3_9BACT|nr:MAG: hypothetical protein CO172_00400 [Candidatus Uhrbacteria bacterium CG_4_9_14_3_um_filter_36_7]
MRTIFVALMATLCLFTAAAQAQESRPTGVTDGHDNLFGDLGEQQEVGAGQAGAEQNGQLVDAVNFVEEVVYFLFDSAELTEQSKLVLQAVARKMKSYSDLRLLVEGNASFEGKPIYNLDLSLRRARAVIRYLVDVCGIEESRLVATHLGNLNPISTKNPAASAENDRRVRFHILGGWFLILKPPPAPSPPPPVINEGDKNYFFDLRQNNYFPSQDLGFRLGGDTFSFEDKPVTDRKWTIGQRLVLSSIVGVLTGSGTAGAVYLADVRADVERTDGVGGHWEVYRNLGREEILGFGLGFVGGFAPTLAVSGTFYWTPDGGFKVKFGNK